MTVESSSERGQSLSFGVRLQTARETKGWDRKDAAMQLRLNEKVIAMMEEEVYSLDLPPTFIKGYLRAYAKLLQVSEEELNNALNALPMPVRTQGVLIKSYEPMNRNNYFMQFFTVVIVLILAGLAGEWWYSHSMSPPVSADKTDLPALLPLNSTSLPKAESQSTVSSVEDISHSAQVASPTLQGNTIAVDQNKIQSDSTKQQVEVKTVQNKKKLTGKKSAEVEGDEGNTNEE